MSTHVFNASDRLCGDCNEPLCSECDLHEGAGEHVAATDVRAIVERAIRAEAQDYGHEPLPPATAAVCGALALYCADDVPDAAEFLIAVLYRMIDEAAVAS